MKLFTVIILSAFACVCSGLLVGPVRLAHNKRYITYQLGPSPKNSTIECPVMLEGGDGNTEEVLASVSWIFWKNRLPAGTFMWYADGREAQADGALKDAVNLGRSDWYLELITLRYDLLGHYSCSATLTNGKSEEAEQWEVIIIDTTSNKVSTWSYESQCVLQTGHEAFAVFPEPTVRSGMYSASLGGYYDEVTSSQWIRHEYSNMSVAYSYKNCSFKIDEDTPTDVKFMTVQGVTKSDNTFISLTTGVITSSIWTTRGCAAVKRGEYQQVKYFGCSRTCRNEYSPTGHTGEAVVTCKEGYHADGEVKSVSLSCPSDSLTWTAEQDHSQLKCVYNFGSMASLPSLAMLTMALLLQRLLL